MVDVLGILEGVIRIRIGILGEFKSVFGKLFVFLWLMLRKIFLVFIIGYAGLVLYLMFFSFGRVPYPQPIARLAPLVSTFRFVMHSIRWSSVFINIVGNLALFVPFGFLGVVFPQYQKLQPLVFDMMSAIIILEAVQYFSRLGIFDVDDILLNSMGVVLGYWIYHELRPFFNYRF